MRYPHHNTVELLYSIKGDTIKPTVQVQDTLHQLIKQEAITRVSKGEDLHFQLNAFDLCTVDVQPGAAGVPLALNPNNLEFVIRRNVSQSGAKLSKQVDEALLSEVVYPSEYWQARYEGLVGIDQIKETVLTMLRTLFSSDLAREWGRKHHPNVSVDELLDDRYSVFLFEGSPGLGKTELARSIGDPLARALGVQVFAYRVGLQVRGDGLVGQLGKNIYKLIEFAKMRHQETGAPILLHVDEADAIAQSRKIEQQHSEEKAGVDTLLQQIDSLRDIPGVALILTTNMPGALDEALKERSAAHWITFPLPSFAARRQLLQRKFSNVLSARDMRTLAWVTDGFSPRAIMQLLTRAVMEAIRLDVPITLDLLLRGCRSLGHAHPGQRHGKPVYSKAHPQRSPKETSIHANSANGAKISVPQQNGGSDSQNGQHPALRLTRGDHPLALLTGFTQSRP